MLISLLVCSLLQFSLVLEEPEDEATALHLWLCVHRFLFIGASTDDDNGKVSSGDGVGTSGSRRPVIVPRVGTYGPVIVPKVGRYGQRPAIVPRTSQGSQQLVTTPGKGSYGPRFMAGGQPSASDDQPSVSVPDEPVIASTEHTGMLTIRTTIDYNMYILVIVTYRHYSNRTVGN